MNINYKQLQHQILIAIKFLVEKSNILCIKYKTFLINIYKEVIS